MSKSFEKTDLSVVVPVYNEEKNVPLLYKAIKDSVEKLNLNYEIIFVDDGSTDSTGEKLKEISKRDKYFKAVLLRKNFGQSAAMAAGFSISTGEIIVTMDGDLQNDPADIPELLKKLDEGYDVVSGWRKNRKDKLFIRKVPSFIANRIICSVTKVNLHDTGCALKAYRKEVITGIRLYGEMHRFLPALTKVEGARIAEIPVNHHARKFGKSKYNLTRTFRVLMDLSSLNLFLKYLRSPLRFFGKLGAVTLSAGMLAVLWALILSLKPQIMVDEINIAVTLAFLFLVAGVQFFFFGMVASLIVRTGERRGLTLSPFLTDKYEDWYESK